MNHIVSQSLAVFAAATLAAITIGAILSPPHVGSLSAAPVLA